MVYLLHAFNVITVMFYNKFTDIQNTWWCIIEVSNVVYYRYQYHEAMVYAINYVNSLDSVLPNISLGYTILDDCTKDQVC